MPFQPPYTYEIAAQQAIKFFQAFLEDRQRSVARSFATVLVGRKDPTRRALPAAESGFVRKGQEVPAQSRCRIAAKRETHTPFLLDEIGNRIGPGAFLRRIFRVL